MKEYGLRLKVQDPSKKQLMQKKAGGIAQLVEHLTRNYEFLNTNPSTKTITRN
jgi:hypothetical protein